MGLITKEVKVRLNSKNIKYYEFLGYNIPKRKSKSDRFPNETRYDLSQPIVVKIEDLTPGSRVMVECTCDYCEKLLSMTYKQYNRAMSCLVPKIACSDCVSKKYEETCLIKYGVKHPMQLDETKEKLKNSFRQKYGVDSPMQLDEVKEKIRKTCLELYGVENPINNPIIKQKISDTCLERYGVSNPFQSKDIQEKIKNTMNQKYGVDNPMQNEEIRERAYQTNIERYGVKHILQNETAMQKMTANNLAKYGSKYISQIPEFRKKAVETMYENSTMCTSKQQKYIAELYNMILNYPILHWSVDMYDEENDICIEYDGKGHALDVVLGIVTQKEFDNKELVREKLIRQDGHKLIRIISRDDNIPSDEILLQMLSDAKQYFSDYPNHSWMNFDIDKGIVRNAENKDGVPYFYGQLRKITKKDLESA